VEIGEQMQFNRAKLETVILYACSKCDSSRLGAVKLNKVLYFLDMLHYAWTGASVTGATYRKRALGPASDHLLYALNEMSRDGAIRINEVDYFGFRKKEYIPLVLPEEDRLSADEKKLLDEVIDFVCFNNTAKTISEYSHQRPWEMVEFGDEIPYYSAFRLFPSEVSSEALDWAESEAERIADSRARSEKVVYTDGAVFRRRLREASGV
jgi:Protein of unknown function (DUF4065)